jgi:hypothetical protein
MKLSKFGKWIAATVGETLTYHTFPCAHWHRIRTQHFTRCCEAAIPTLPPAARGQSAAASTIRSFAHGRGLNRSLGPPRAIARSQSLRALEGRFRDRPVRARDGQVKRQLASRPCW